MDSVGFLKEYIKLGGECMGVEEWGHRYEKNIQYACMKFFNSKNKTEWQLSVALPVVNRVHCIP